MSTFLVVLLIGGLFAMCISTFIFASAARLYVSDDASGALNTSHKTRRAAKFHVDRSPIDRRDPTANPLFPLVLDSTTIPIDRRSGIERRVRKA